MRIGVDLGGTKIEAIAISATGDEIARKRIETPKGDYKGTLEAIRLVVRAVEEKIRNSNDHIRPTVGIGIPGSLKRQSNVVQNSNSTWIIGKNIKKDVEQILERPVRVANDANCFTMSEARDGAGLGYGLVFGVILGTGVGGGISFENKIWNGPNSIAGEWGHNPIPWTDDHINYTSSTEIECYCGKKGCIETFLSGAGLVKTYVDLSAKIRASAITTPELIVKKFEDGDKVAQKCLEIYASRLARSLAHVINLVDPDVIILGGGLSNISYLYATVPELLKRWVFTSELSTPLLKNQHGDSSGVRGAAWLWP